MFLHKSIDRFIPYLPAFILNDCSCYKCWMYSILKVCMVIPHFQLIYYDICVFDFEKSAENLNVRSKMAHLPLNRCWKESHGGKNVSEY